MSVQEIESAEKAKGKNRTFLQAAVGGFVGAVGMVLLLKLARGRFDMVMEPDHLIALGAAFVLLVMAVIVGVGAALPKAGAKVLNVEDEADLRYQQRDLLWSALGLMLGAVWPLALALSGDGGLLDRNVALGLLAGSLLLTVIISAVVKLRSDELDKMATMETGALSYYGIFVVFGGWAALAHLGFVPRFTMLGFFAGSLAIWILMLFIALGKRGMLSNS